MASSWFVVAAVFVVVVVVAAILISLAKSAVLARFQIWQRNATPSSCC